MGLLLGVLKNWCFFNASAVDAAVSKVPPPLGYTHVGAQTHIGRSDPYPAIAALTDLPDHDIGTYIRNLEEPLSQATSVPVQHSNWLTEALSTFHL